MTYLTYDEYIEMGGTLDVTTFTSLEFRAETEIDWYTFNRLWDEETISERVKRCVFEIIKIIYEKGIATSMPLQDGQTSSGMVAGIASQSNDGVSISYNVLSASEIVEQSKSEIRDIISKFLNGERTSLGRKLLYRGIYPGE